MSAAVNTSGAPYRTLLGRTFVHPAFDYLLIGGALSLVVGALMLSTTEAPVAVDLRQPFQALIERPGLIWLALFCSSAHFAASTVRLYTKPGATDAHPFLAAGFPLVTLGALTLCIAFSGVLGPALQSVYLTWSPYHYTAQAYGLAVMYSYRSGCQLTDVQKKWLRYASLLPFANAVIRGAEAGLFDWLVPREFVEALFAGGAARVLSYGLATVGFAAPVAIFLLVRRAGGAMPLLAPLVLITNGFWWFVFAPLDAFIWAATFHGVQYLAIVIVFHVQEQKALPGNRHGTAYHVAWFYGSCLLVAYALFNCLPQAFVLAGFGATESLLMVLATINLHHFIVDGFIWKLGRRDPNRAVVEAQGAVVQAAG